MTPKERVNRFFKREPIDTMPCFSGMGMVTIQVINEMGIRFPEVHTSAEYLARSAVMTAEMFGYDAAIIPYDMGTVPEALGRGISLYENTDDILYPTVPTKWATIHEVDIPENFLSRGRIPLVDEAFELIKSQTNGNLALGGWVLGPFTMAGQIVELDLFLKGVRKEKEATEAFMNKMTDLVIKVAKHYEALGADYMYGRGPFYGLDSIEFRNHGGNHRIGDARLDYPAGRDRIVFRRQCRNVRDRISGLDRKTARGGPGIRHSRVVQFSRRPDFFTFYRAVCKAGRFDFSLSGRRTYRFAGCCLGAAAPGGQRPHHFQRHLRCRLSSVCQLFCQARLLVGPG